MPDYLDYDTSLNDLTPEEAAEMLSQQDVRLKAVIEHLNSPESAESELMECVVSV